MRPGYPRSVCLSTCSRGFTLIELLVVVAIIALLSAMLFPVLHSVRTIARRVACASNLRQIALSWQSYLDDHKGCFYQALNANHEFGGWKGTGFCSPVRPLNPYLSLPLEFTTENEAKVFRCPADTGGVLGAPTPQELAYHWYGNSYQTNIYLVGQNRVSVPSGPTAEFYKELNKRISTTTRDEVSEHSRLLLVGDNNWYTQFYAFRPDGVHWHGREHYFNMAFLDGHVDFVRICKGLWVAPGNYRVLPFSELDDLAPRPSD